MVAPNPATAPSLVKLHGRDITKTTLEPLLGNGAYRIDDRSRPFDHL